MEHPRAWLVDVYDTVLSVDFGAVVREGARRVGVDPLRFMAASRAEDGGAMVSPTGMADAVPRILRRCGVDPADGLAESLLAAYPALMREHCTMHKDAVDFLHRLRAAGTPTAFVSNCAEDTRPLLADLGLDRLVDVLVLSCELRAAKPAPAIYAHALAALAALDVPAERAVMLDDQARYCQGAVEAGLSAVRIVRPAAGHDGSPDPAHPLLVGHPAHIPVVATCASLEP
ncbi:HAD family hydrolase [Kineosporia sp. A_224]|uniref:HAD family hydrolase n=1 Tax=Kineosporia sp. A_224 TaxID=1962180 RepID=UPI000B4A9794|nr:HAD-IA family hydrolase [Kineosporia sp. A_224]